MKLNFLKDQKHVLRFCLNEGFQRKFVWNYELLIYNYYFLWLIIQILILDGLDKYFSKILSAKNSLSIYIPPGFAHGFCALDKENFVVYSCTQYRNAKSEIGIKYNDQDLNIKWPIKKPILSIKDKKNYSIKEFYNKING